MARIIVDEPVIARVVEPAERQGRAEFTAFGGVVVDDVENDLDAGRVQAPHCDAHLVDRAVGEIARLDRKEADGVVAPIVAQPLLQQKAVLHERLDRHQFDRGNAEPAQMIDHALIGERREGSSFVGTDVVAQHGQAAHVGFINDGVGPWNVGGPVVAPVEAVVGDDRLDHPGRAVAPVEGEIGALRGDPKTKQSVGPAQTPVDAPRIRIEQQLMRIESVPGLRLVGSMGAITIEQARTRIGQIAVPDFIGELRQREARDLASPRRIEQTKLDPLGMRREHCEIDAETVPGGAERVGRAGDERGGRRHWLSLRAATGPS
jgi:hypothetical protein